MRLLDACSGAGGAAKGYARAGWEVVGVDHRPQPSYPYEFHQADAVEYLRGLIDTGEIERFDAIHASPPCKLYTVARRVHTANRPTLFEPHPDVLEPMRELLQEASLPYVIENVPGAPLQDPVVCCGSAFGLQVRRHRLFESNVPLEGSGCRHEAQPHPVGVYGNGGAWTRKQAGGGGRKVAGAEAARAMGIDWTEHQPELAQAIPPAYTEHIGRQLREAVACQPR